MKTIGIASDHAGFELKELIKNYLQKENYEVVDFGTHSTDSMDYPDVAHPLASAVERSEVFPGIAICGSGNGISMTVNKHTGVRAALCWTPELSKLAREHNDANILSLPARFITVDVALEIVRIFLETPFEGGRHQNRVNKIPCR
ncbi:MAG: ribose 5-phosphate isomerase B [Bacteroidales bacterium]